MASLVQPRLGVFLDSRGIPWEAMKSLGPGQVFRMFFEVKIDGDTIG